jgi:ubiquinone/menaquinone biosynthesis C-methylase UbiE
MTTSRSFDRAADVYDQTRDLPEPVATHGLPAILEQAGLNALILEVGTGTGRISLPLLERGANLFGCDLSAKMMARQREKYPAARVAQADAARLPFASRQFDALLTVHVIHLVGPWREALGEFRRVLRPGGVYINTWGGPMGASADEQIRAFWWSRVAVRGIALRKPGVQSREELLDELRALGATLAEIDVTRYPNPLAPRKVIDAIAARVYSDTWDIPDDILEATLSELREWAAREYGDIDQVVQQERRFVLDVARFQG